MEPGELPQLGQGAQLAADLPDEGPPGIVPGARVFALYDKVYYPAIVLRCAFCLFGCEFNNRVMLGF